MAKKQNRPKTIPVTYDVEVFILDAPALVDAWEEFSWGSPAVTALFYSLTLEQVDELVSTLDPHNDSITLIPRIPNKPRATREVFRGSPKRFLMWQAGGKEVA